MFELDFGFSEEFKKKLEVVYDCERSWLYEHYGGQGLVSSIDTWTNATTGKSFTTNHDEIKKWLDGDEAMREKFGYEPREWLIKRILSALINFKDVHHITLMGRTAPGSFDEWKELYDALPEANITFGGIMDIIDS